MRPRLLVPPPNPGRGEQPVPGPVSCKLYLMKAADRECAARYGGAEEQDARTAGARFDVREVGSQRHEQRRWKLGTRRAETPERNLVVESHKRRAQVGSVACAENLLGKDPCAIEDAPRERGRVDVVRPPAQEG